VREFEIAREVSLFIYGRIVLLARVNMVLMTDQTPHVRTDD